VKSVAQQANSPETTSETSPESSGSGDQQQTLQRPARDQRQGSQQPSGNEEPKRLSLAELFADDGEGSNRESGLDDDGNGPVDSIDKLVKRHGLTAEQVYAIKVPMAQGGEPLSIGELKDRVGELVDLEQRELEFDQRRRTGEGELLRAQQEMRDLLALVPKDKLNPAVLEKIRAKHEATQASERRAVLEHIPQWQDEKRRTEDLQGMVELLAEYGFAPEFMATVVDHRAVKMIRDFYLMDRRIKTALAKVKDVKKPAGQRTSGKTAKSAARPNSNQSSRSRVVPDQATRIRNIFGDN